MYTMYSSACSCMIITILYIHSCFMQLVIPVRISINFVQQLLSPTITHITLHLFSLGLSKTVMSLPSSIIDPSLLICSSGTWTDSYPPSTELVQCYGIYLPWFIMAECPSCSITWYIHTKCTGMKLRFPNTFRCNRHHKMFHDKSPSSSQKRSLSAIYDNNSEDDACYHDQVECDSDSVSQPIASSIKEIIMPSHSLMQLLHESATNASFNPHDFQHVESQVFFSKEHEATSKGAAYLVGRSQFSLQHTW